MRRKLALIAGVAAAALAVLLGHAPAAHADEGVDGASCTGGCSETVNQSAYSVLAFRNWCTSGSTGSSTTTQPTCTVDGVAQQWSWISPGNQTPSGQDWDGFRVDAGWCYNVTFYSYIYGFSWRTYNRVGASHLYVKVSNDATAYVTAQRYGSCP